ncbi:thiol reductant ABC exporter subunit CydC [Pseudochelatococcus lubricantis]|uniref:thiol reductant ABC exporter subunit CydC n=1 Tax=Pseudochelatococcus lubricantis TaxID=1538102 RepID=UPI00363FF739
MRGGWRDMRPILALFWAGQRRMLLLGVVLAALTMLAGVALLGLSGWFIAAAALAGLLPATALAFDVFAPAAGVRLLALVRTAGRYGERLTTHDATLAILATIRERLFRGWARPGMARRLLMRPATLLFRLTADVDALDSVYLRVIVPAVAAIATALLAGGAVALAHAWTGLALAVALLAAGLGIPLAVARAGRRQARLRAFALEALRARTIDLSSGQTELVMAGQLAAQCERVLAADGRLSVADDALHRLDTYSAAGFGLVSTSVLTAMLLTVGVLVEGGAIGAPVAALLLLVALAALEPFAGLQRGALELGRTLLSARRLGPQLADAGEAAASAARPTPGLALALERVTFFHDGADCPVLDDLSLTISEGEVVALVGPSGAGKSTLLALLAGELQPRTGTVRAQPLTLLPQRTELFQDSLRDNLRLAAPAAPAASDTLLWQALDDAGLAAGVRRMSSGLDTRLGEGGLGLSGGQARRLALARLLLRPDPLWLIDEATEGLDAVTARDVLRRLHGAAKTGGRTMLIATHVRREAEAADRLVVMAQGHLIRDVRRSDPAFAETLASLRPD